METIALANIVLSLISPLIFLLVFLFIGLFIQLVLVRSKTILEITLVTVFTGIAAVTLALFLAAFFGLTIRGTSRILVLTCVLATPVLIKIKQIRIINTSGTRILMIASINSALVFLPKLIEKGMEGTLLPVISLTNNDIAYYLATAVQFENSGFNDSRQIDQINLNLAVQNYQYFTPTAIFAFLHSLLGQWIGFYATPVLILSSVLLFLGIYSFLHVFFKDSPNIFLILITWIATSFSLHLYIVANGFLAQVIALAIVSFSITSFGVLLEKKELDGSKRQSQVLLTWISISILCIFSYPAILLPCLIFLLLALTAFLVLKRISFKKFALVLAGSATGTFLSFPYLNEALGLFKLLFQGSFGWKLPPLNVFSALLFPNTIGKPFGTELSFLSWVILIVLALVAAFKFTSDTTARAIGVVTIIGPATIVLIYANLSDEGFSAYGTWKLISYLMPFVISIFLSLFLLAKRLNVVFLSFVSGCLLVAPTLLWQINPGLTSNQKFVELRSSVKVQELNSINVDLPTGFETMLATTLFDNRTRLFLQSESYLPLSTNYNSCTLLRDSHSSFPFFFRLNSEYVLGSMVSESCSQFRDLNLVDSLNTNVTSKFRLGLGWWDLEDWGVWMKRNNATLPFSKKLNVGDELSVRFRSLGSVPHKILNPQIKLNSRVIEISEEEFLDGVVTIRLQQSDIDSKSQYILAFSVDKLITPQMFGFSNDQREIGLGLENVSFTKPNYKPALD